MFLFNLMKTKLIILLFAIVASGSAFAESGTCGKNLTWDLTDGVLTISGTGAMRDFDYNGSPWYSYRTKIKTIKINNGVTSIGNYAFQECSSLTSITIPNSVTSIGNYAFRDCSSLESVYIEDVAAWCGIKFDNNTANPLFCAHHLYLNGKEVLDLVIPNGVTSIGNYAFHECNSLTGITIPNSVTSIGANAFYDCSSLESVVFGSSLKIIGDYAFSGFNNIMTITCYSRRPPTASTNALGNLPYSTIVYVPADYMTYYQIHDFWGLYDVRPIGVKTVETNDVKVIPADNSADVVWPVVSGAATYELVIKDKQGNIICTLTFNSQGQLTQIAFSAPGHGKVPEQTMTEGFSFTITGLNEGTPYAKDSAGKTLQTFTQNFYTLGTTGIDDLETNDPASLNRARKVMEDGKVFILLPDGKRYTLQGAEVR